MGFETPTPIQAEVIPLILSEPKDIIGLAQTGTGKTAAFGLPLLELVDIDDRNVQALILSPTRELCLQITRNLQDYSKYLRDLDVVAVYGGDNIRTQISALKKGAQIVVATPGRLIDLLERKAISLANIGYVVLDEADEMLKMGFKEDLDHILTFTPAEKFTWLFSATMSNEIKDITRRFMKSPYEVSTGQRNVANENITHQFAIIQPRLRLEALKRFIDNTPDLYALIFCRTRMDTMDVAESLMKDGYNAGVLNGDLTQAQRDKVMKSFRSRTVRILVATDVAARGIDVDDVSHVFHLNLPDELESYTHRAGRTARKGKTGFSLALVTKSEVRRIKLLEKTIKTNFVEVTVPTGQEICENQVLNYIGRLEEVNLDSKLLQKLMPDINARFDAFTREDLINRVVALEMSRVLDQYNKSGDHAKISADRDDRGERGDRGERSDRGRDNERDRDGGFNLGKSFFIQLGQRDGFQKGQLLKLICEQAGIKSSMIGRINLSMNHAVFDVDAQGADAIIPGFTGFEWEGRTVRVNEELNAASSRSSERNRGGGGSFSVKKGYADFKGSPKAAGKSFDRFAKKSRPSDKKKY